MFLEMECSIDSILMELLKNCDFELGNVMLCTKECYAMYKGMSCYVQRNVMLYVQRNATVVINHTVRNKATIS